MPEDPDLSFVLCVVSGALAIAAGAFGAMNLTPSFAGVLGFLALIRICWLDDNIANDLLDRDVLPQSYRNAQRRQEHIESFLLGRPWGDKDLTPALVATRMRAEADVWLAVILSGTAALLAQTAPLGGGLSALLAFLGFGLAFRTADKVSATLWMVECGRPLPREALVRRHVWAHSTTRDRD